MAPTAVTTDRRPDRPHLPERRYDGALLPWPEEGSAMSIAASSRTERLAAAMGPVQRMVESRAFARAGDPPSIADLCSATRTRCRCPRTSRRSHHNVVPQDKDWFAYKMNEPIATRTVAANPRAHGPDSRAGRRVHDQRRVRGDGRRPARAGRAGRRGDVPVAAVVLLRAADPAAGARRYPSGYRAPGFAIDAAALAGAITPRTRAIIVNSPNNPSGRV